MASACKTMLFQDGIFQMILTVLQYLKSGVCMCVCVGQRQMLSVFLNTHSSVLRQGFSLILELTNGLAGWPVSPRDPPVSSSPPQPLPLPPSYKSAGDGISSLHVQQA